jgi:diguanylate cyclase (GGDEF)-like protein
MRVSTRTTGLAAGVMILVAMPLWSLYDRMVVPDLADRFFTLRIAVLVPILIGWLLLLKRPFGDLHAEGLVLIVCVLPQMVVAWLLPSVDHALEGYLLGFSLVIYGCAFLLVGRLWITVALVACSWVATMISFGLQADRADDVEVGTIAFYLGTASILAAVGRFYRMRLERDELGARLALEAEQERTLVLVGELDRLSREDSLTGVANRRAWDEALARSCAQAERTGRPLSVLLLDIDRFKDINDEHGHRRGDEVLQEVAGSLTGRIRGADLLARVGGDEFAVLCPDTDPEGARHLADHLIDLVAAMPGELTVSVGAAVRLPGAGPDAVMGLADRRLYEAKRARVTPVRPRAEAGAP